MAINQLRQHSWKRILRGELPEKYKQVWSDAWQYQDAREDPGHAEVVTSFALEISKKEKVIEKTVTFAAILHDIGWSSLTEKERMLIFDKSHPKDEI